MPQGTVLGPLYFLIYINDINQNLSKLSKMRLFADDSLVYREIKNSKDCKALQEDLDSLQEWEKTWKMEFHPDKCQVLKITNKKNKVEDEYTLHGQTLKESNKAKYLGVTIDNKLDWKEHQNAMCNKANNVLAFLKRNLGKCPTNIKDKCYKAFVKPILGYGGCVWDPHHKNKIENIEKVQKRAGRFVTNNYRMSHGNTKKNMSKLGWIPLEEDRARNKVTRLFKTINNITTIPINNLSTTKVNTRRGNNKFLIPHSSVDSHKYSYFPSTLRLWNNLPSSIKLGSDVNTFKKNIKHIELIPLKR